VRRLFLGQFPSLLNRALFFGAAGAVLKIGLSLKPNHHREHAQIRETLCIFMIINFYSYMGALQIIRDTQGWWVDKVAERISFAFIKSYFNLFVIM